MTPTTCVSPPGGLQRGGRGCASLLKVYPERLRTGRSPLSFGSVRRRAVAPVAVAGDAAGGAGVPALLQPCGCGKAARPAELAGSRQLRELWACIAGAGNRSSQVSAADGVRLRF